MTLTNLQRAFAAAAEWHRTSTPEQKAAMRQKQRESWQRAMAPCEHGALDWEACPQCRDEQKELQP
jgi:hypothetical protein